MAITLTTAAQNAAADAILGLIDAGAGAGTIELKSAASTVAGTNEVATLTFSDPAFGAAASGTAWATSRPMPTTCAPCPGNRNAVFIT